METSEQNCDTIADNEPQTNNSRKSANIKINTFAIPCIADDEQETELRCLGITAYHQSVYEEGVMRQVDSAMNVNPVVSQSSHQFVKHIFDSNGDTGDVLSDGTPESRDSDHMSNRTFNFNNDSIAHISSSSTNTLSCDRNLDCVEISTKYNKRAKRESDYSDDDSDDGVNRINRRVKNNDDEWLPTDGEDNEDNDYLSDEQLEFESYATDADSDDQQSGAQTSKKKSHSKAFAKKSSQSKPVYSKIIDDGSEKHYQKRIKDYKKQRVLEMHQNILPNGTEIKNLDEFFELDHGYRIPKKIWDQLFAYQQTGVRWLWELHRNGCGGIVGDEMGLGKTIQIIAFFCGLMCSKFHDFRDLFTSLGPVILVCPATIMYQWVAEFHKWWPYFRVAVLHQTGSFTGSRETLIRNTNRANGILITSYSSIYKFQKILGKYDWHYVILDEGHKIRNPDAKITLACKMFNTPHRIILSGSPIQNNLRELWSLFDFVYPGKLGTLQVFMEHFAVPITQGGYANATQVQIQVAYKCATVLRDAIKPYLLRRMKDEVKSSLVLPSKNEQVLFCKLTDDQRQIYKSYLDSSVVKEIMRGSTQIFVGLINLRKICNHPHLFNVSAVKNEMFQNDCEQFGYYKKSGKMIVVDALLRLWYNQSHKVLLFSQSRQMLKILENFLNYRKYRYLLMDGTTAVQLRQSAIKQFNEDKDIFIFLLTTRVGGIGVNLTGANRVLIYDPDWNPSTDVQARERCWRIGQNRNVTIYRLLSAGTVEEKIYHRQIFKQYLTNRVLKDPKQRRFFKTNDLHELFTLASESDNTESSAIFAGTDSEVKVNHKAKKPLPQEIQENSQTNLPPEKIVELREKAKMLSRMIAKKFANETNCVGVNSSPDNDIFGNKSSETVTNNLNHINNKVDSSVKGKKTKKGVKFEGKRIKYLLKQDQYKDSTIKGVNSNEDDYVLKKLFKRSKVHSALQHDNIECTSTPDFALAEKEAEMVAKQSISALKRSRDLCSQTWTPLSSLSKSSKFGQKRKLNVVSENEMSSTSLLRDIKSRNKFDADIEPNESIENGSNDILSVNVNTDCDQLLADIRNYIAFQSTCNGEATTEELLDAFKTKLQPHQSAVFKSLLWQLCEFYRRSDKVGVWRLKSEFR